MHWKFPDPQPIPDELQAFVGDSLLAQLLVQRGVTTVAQARGFLNPADYRPTPPEEMPDVPAAVARLNRAIARAERICVWGDFDVDGQTSTTLLVETLQNLGATVRYFIPNRLTDSHGIKLPALHRQIEAGLDVLLTCDTGVAEHEAVQAAQAAGADVLITDHHDLPPTLPPAQAVVNPKRLPPQHPLRELPGVGVALILAQALCQSRGQAAPDSLLELAALGIVADVARQTGDTRYWLQRGLAALRQTRRPGLHALLENTNLKPETLTEEHISFWLAPRLNALGRLGDANLAVELLTTTNRTRARTVALQLEALNDRRKMLVDQVVVEALAQLENTPSLAEYNALVLAGSGWHPGVIGIAASRLVEQFGKPAVLIALRPGDVGRGSARSVPGCDIHRAIRTQADLLLGFGGHPAAAGLSLPAANVRDFRRGLSAALDGCAPARRQLAVDAQVELAQISPGLLASIRRLAPFGAGNPPVMLAAAGLTLVSEAAFGRTGDHKRLTVGDDSGAAQEVIWWRGGRERSPQGRFDLAFSIGPDEYRGEGVQVLFRAAKEWEPAPVASQITFADWRQFDAATVAARLREFHHAIIWAEGESAPPDALPRHKLTPAETLVVFTAPPGQDVFATAAAAVRPAEIVLVAQPSPLDAPAPFTRRLLGLLKHAIVHRHGEASLNELAGALAHRPATVRLALDWLAAQGKIDIEPDPDVLLVRPANRPADARAAAELEAMLASALAETAAFRQFFRRVGTGTLARSLE